MYKAWEETQKRQPVSLLPGMDAEVTYAHSQSPWGSVTDYTLRPARRKPLTAQSYFSGILPNHTIQVQNQAPLPCSCLLYPSEEWHRLMKHCPTFRNSAFLGRQARKQRAMLTWHADPCLHLRRHRRVQAELCSTGTHICSPRSWGICSVWVARHRSKERRLLEPVIGLDLALARVALEAWCSPQDTGCSWHQAARTRSLPAAVRALTCPVAQRNLCPQKHQIWQSQ